MESSLPMLDLLELACDNSEGEVKFEFCLCIISDRYC